MIHVTYPHLACMRELLIITYVCFAYVCKLQSTYAAPLIYSTLNVLLEMRLT